MIWRRDMVRLWRQCTRLLGAVARALVWLFAMGFGLCGAENYSRTLGVRCCWYCPQPDSDGRALAWDTAD